MVVMMRRVCWLLVVPLLAGCSALGLTSSGRSGSSTVVASFYPLQYVAQRIVGRHAKVEVLTHPGVEPHDYTLTVQQTAEVADADVVFYERGLQASVDAAVAQTAQRHVVDAAQASPPTGGNPHIWLDPLRMRAIAHGFLDAMLRADPAHARDYRANYATFAAQLVRLDHAYASGLAHCAITTVVVSHDAYGYLSRYGLNFAYVNGLSPDAEPSPAHIRALQDLIRAKGVTTIFSEPLASPALVTSLAHDLGLTTAVLDPIEGLTAATADQNYLSLMTANLTTLEKAQECR
jgi:zinc transport system substrate-binding protein